VPEAPLGLHTDLYELRMAATCLRHGRTDPATFSLYIRPDPARPWFLAAGIEQALEVLRRFRYGSEELAYLRTQGIPEDALDWLAHVEPSGEVWAVPEGTVVLGEEPLLEVTAPLPLAMLWETALMNVLHRSTLLATKAARCVLAAQGRQVADFGFRRAHGLETGVEASRAAYLGGASATSNVEAARRYGIPATGTMAHSLIQSWGDETAAFQAFAEDNPDHAVLLIDTYDTLQGARNAIAVGRRLREAGGRLLGVRLDSGDLDALSRRVRALLDDAGFDDTRIIASGGVDEGSIAALVAADAPIDAFGVGTSMVVSRDRPAVDVVYKLVAYAGAPRAKYSEGKSLLPGAKQVHRDGSPETDVLTGRDDPSPGGTPLLAPVWRDGIVLAPSSLEEARARAGAALAALPPAWHPTTGPIDPPRPRIGPALERRARELAAEELGQRA
jgi:nicotinate phosphoribosyltransferase